MHLKPEKLNPVFGLIVSCSLLASQAFGNQPGIEFNALTGMYPQGDGKEKTLYYGLSVGVNLPIDDKVIALNAVEYSQTRQEDLLGVKVRKSRMQFFYGLRYSPYSMEGDFFFRGFHALSGAVILEEKHNQFGNLGDFQHQKTRLGLQTGASTQYKDVIVALDLKADDMKRWSKEELSIFLSVGFDLFQNSLTRDFL